MQAVNRGLPGLLDALDVGLRHLVEASHRGRAQACARGADALNAARTDSADTWPNSPEALSGGSCNASKPSIRRMSGPRNTRCSGFDHVQASLPRSTHGVAQSFGGLSGRAPHLGKAFANSTEHSVLKPVDVLDVSQRGVVVVPTSVDVIVSNSPFRRENGQSRSSQ